MKSQTGIERAVVVLDAVAEAGGPLRFKQLRAALGGISQSTVSRILQLLVAAGALRKTGDNRYALTEKVALWGRAAPQPTSITDLAQPLLDQLNQELQVTSSLFAAPDGNITCLDRRLDPASPSSGQPGRSFPLDVTKMGSMFFASTATLRSDAYYPDRVGARGLPKSREFLEDWVQQTLAADFMDDPGYISPWSGRLAVPIRSGGGVIAVLAIAFPAARLDGEEGFHDRARDLLIDLGRQLARRAELLQAPHAGAS